MASSSASSAIISNVPAVVEWLDADGQVRHLYQTDRVSAPQAAFDIHFDHASKYALFKLIVMVKLGSSRKRTPFYIHIEPERVRTLGYDGPDQVTGYL